MQSKRLVIISIFVIGLVILVAAGSVVGMAFTGDGQAGDTSTTSAATTSDSFSQHEAGFEGAPATMRIGHDDRYTIRELRRFDPPTDGRKIALQVGHLRNDEVPAEMSQLERNGPGATWGELTEREVVHEIATRTAAMLRADGYEVDVLPATVPSGYYADAFVSIHADGNPDESVRGYKTAHFSHDYSGASPYLEDAVASAHASSTGLPENESVTYYMTGYYAFNWWRYEHALHPMTPAMILETGYLTNAQDRAVIVDQPAVVARGIADGVRRFLASDARARAMPRATRFPQPPFTGRYRCLEGELDPNDDPDEVDGCRPGIVTGTSSRSRAAGEDGDGQDETDDNDEEQDEGPRYGLLFPDMSTTTALADIDDGDRVEVDGAFTPMIEVRDLSWYSYHVRGVIDVTRIVPDN